MVVRPSPSVVVSGAVDASDRAAEPAVPLLPQRQQGSANLGSIARQSLSQAHMRSAFVVYVFESTYPHGKVTTMWR